MKPNEADIIKELKKHFLYCDENGLDYEFSPFHKDIFIKNMSVMKTQRIANKYVTYIKKNYLDKGWFKKESLFFIKLST